jgi:predicted RNA binding protein YcfA (HicA-like mRNA interferase family)
VQISQKGSHVKIRRFLNGEKQTLTIPNHKMIARPTLHDIHQQALPYISAEELRKEFFAE